MAIWYTYLTLFILTLLVLAIPLSDYMVKVFTNKVHFLQLIERPIYAVLQADAEMSWQQYTLGLLLFNLIGIVFVFAIQMYQQFLPLNPQHFSHPSWDLALNTAISFVTNTNWQAYKPETSISYFTTMVALASQNFLSAATGIVVLLALIRGIVRTRIGTIGNVWHDLIRVTLYILMPLSLIGAILLLILGVPQSISNYQVAKLIAPQHITQTINNQAITQTITEQVLPIGPIASQEAIKLLGTNGGGLFSANSAHPYENPNVESNNLEMLLILLIPTTLCFAFGTMVGDKRQGYTIYITMTIMFVIFASFEALTELHGNPLLDKVNINNMTHDFYHSMGNMQGKENRFGILGSSLFVAVTTATSCGAINTLHESLMPFGGLISMFFMQLEEVVYGGVGSGLYGMLIYIILLVFIAGLMIGRTPEYLGKKIESFDMKMIAIIILAVPCITLFSTAISLIVAPGIAGIHNHGAHGLSEVLYAYTSASHNNGSAFSGLYANSLYYNLLLGSNMLIGRYGIIIAILAIAGSLAKKKMIPITSGTLHTHGILFIILLIIVIILLALLTYIPALILGPIVEHLLLFK